MPRAVTFQLTLTRKLLQKKSWDFKQRKIDGQVTEKMASLS